MTTTPVPAVNALMSVEDVCAYLGVSRNFVYRQVQAGNLRGSRIARQRRFKPEDVEEFVDGNQPVGEAAATVASSLNPGRLV